MEELDALHQAWLQAAAKWHSTAPNEALIYWHDRWFHPCTKRLREVTQFRLCVDGHQTAMAARTVDRDLLEATRRAAKKPQEQPVDGQSSPSPRSTSRPTGLRPA